MSLFMLSLIPLPLLLRLVLPRLLLGVVVIFVSACGGGSNQVTEEGGFFAQAEQNEERSAGNATVFKSDSTAFSEPSANMSVSRKLAFEGGDGFFTDPWIPAPPSNTGRDGLGPLFNVASCERCHIKDGRGHAPVNSGDSAATLLIRLSLPRSELTNDEKTLLDNGLIGNVGDLTYGGQFQDAAITNSLPEGTVSVSYQTVTMEFADGFQVDLRKPTFTLTSLNYGSLDTNIILSPRVAPPMIGLGMLEAIPDAVLEAAEDINDSNGDGVSGRVNRVFDAKTLTVAVVGRFGWKAGQPNVRQQSAGAFNGDIGVTSSLFPKQNCTAVQLGIGECDPAVSGGNLNPDDPEVANNNFENVSFYSRNLAVPARRLVNDSVVLEGKKLFYESGCIACHTPKYQLPNLPVAQKEQSGQLIWPYTDMLLHDMGDSLSDGNATSTTPLEPVEFLATGAEWRTPPLWGIGLAKTVSPEATFLHDGRARTLLEAVLWHGGEAEDTKNAVLTFDMAQRAALVAFLESL